MSTGKRTKSQLTISGILKQGTDILKEAGIENPVSEAVLLLSHVLGKDKSYLFAHGEEILEDHIEKKYREYLKRRAGRMPMAYVTGVKEFMSLEFIVTPQVLIPRPETELLVETVINYVNRICNKKIKILDLGTGSGCIAVSLAYYTGNLQVTAVDISESALETARMNGEKHGVEVEFICCSMFDGLEGRRFDIIVSNPPYIPSGEIGKLDKDVKYFEPVTALDGGSDGLDFYREITGKAADYLEEGGLLVVEVGNGQAEAVAQMMTAGFSDVRVHKDISGIPRVVEGKLKEGRLYTKCNKESLNP